MLQTKKENSALQDITHLEQYSLFLKLSNLTTTEEERQHVWDDCFGQQAVQELIKPYPISSTLSLLIHSRYEFLNWLSFKFVNEQIASGYEIAFILKYLTQKEEQLDFVKQISFIIDPEKIQDGYEIGAILENLLDEQCKMAFLNSLGLNTVFIRKVPNQQQLNCVLKHLSKEHQKFFQISWNALEEQRKKRSEKSSEKNKVIDENQPSSNAQKRKCSDEEQAISALSQLKSVVHQDTTSTLFSVSKKRKGLTTTDDSNQIPVSPTPS